MSVLVCVTIVYHAMRTRMLMKQCTWYSFRHTSTPELLNKMRILFAIRVLVNLLPVCVPVCKRDTLHIAVIQLGIIVLQHTSTLALLLHTNKLPTTPLHNMNCSQQSTCTSPWTTTITNIDWSTEYAITYKHNNMRKKTLIAWSRCVGQELILCLMKNPWHPRNPIARKKLHLKQNLQQSICLHRKKNRRQLLNWNNYQSERI